MIIPMKKAVFVCLKEERKKVMIALQECGEIMIIPHDEAKEHTKHVQIERLCQDTKQLIEKVKQYQKESSFYEETKRVTFDEFMQESEERQRFAKHTEKIINKLDDVKEKQILLSDKLEQLKPWRKLVIPVEEIKNTTYTTIFTGYIPFNTVVEMKKIIDIYDADCELYDHSEEGIAALIVCCNSDAHKLYEEIKQNGFIDEQLLCKKGTIEAECESLRKQIAKKKEEELTLITKIQELTARLDDLKVLYEQYEAEAAREMAPYVETKETMYIEGWVRCDRLEKVENYVKKVTKNYVLSYFDPAPEEDPPTVTKNNWFVSQFETITNMFSRPNTGEIDPNAVMAPWYWIIFGLMVGDAGYGLIMAVLFFFYKKVKQPTGEMEKLINILYLSSISTTIWGVILGSYFGQTWHPLLFSPLDNPVGMLVLSLIIGVLHIFSGMAIKIAANIRKGRVWDALFDEVSWMVLITGLPLLFFEQTAFIGKVMAIAGAVTVVLTAGRSKKGFFGKVFGGLLGLYNITNYMSDILSYSRILALCLATSVVGMVMNMLAGMIQGSIIGFLFSILIYIAGHIFNLALSLLSSYVHDSRLQYIEFYNKFYEGGGKAFTPLTIEPKTIHLQLQEDTKESEVGEEEMDQMENKQAL